ncbi:MULTISPECIES: EF-hand domain-containing protein [unclassified Sphingomonas]|uniref:EF-hand domain-containing protein n=1 Tax=unclassified Sphingomonas TaxID=196159 RepID=UPI002151AFD4|nr:MULTISPECIES: EF-hand domain-containing protein [unclassified Sphingomonas]MCR5869824.1 EF-hand domain-containing protein [Sphingomonas sp. J344]UUX98474.1 EF-hand domain-containing protein [Sphingomonas sp. J315]
MNVALALLAFQAQPMGVAPGPLPRAEAERRAAERFADLDLNEDGSIERDEVRARFDFEGSAEATYAAARQSKKASAPRAPVSSPRTDWAKADAWFAAVDKDGDGKVTRAELGTYLGADVEQIGVQ